MTKNGDHKRLPGGHQKITEVHDHKGGEGMACKKKIGQAESVHKENIYSQDQLSIGGTIFLGKGGS